MGGSGREDGASQPSGAPSSAPSGAPPGAPPPPPCAAEPRAEGLVLGDVAVAGVEDDEMMADVAALAGGGSGSDALATLEGALRPIERYAVRIVEEVRPRIGPLVAMLAGFDTVWSMCRGKVLATLAGAHGPTEHYAVRIVEEPRPVMFCYYSSYVPTVHVV